MAQIYHGLNGQELKSVVLQRVNQALSQADEMKALRAYPLVKYRVIVEITPYGDPYQRGGEWMLGAARETRTVCNINGQEFMEVKEDSVAFVEDSPVIGFEVDPQEVRDQAGIGRIVTERREGQFVDVNAKPKAEERSVDLVSNEPAIRRTREIPRPEEPPKETAALIAEPTVAPAHPADAERIAREEQDAWANAHRPDHTHEQGLAKAAQGEEPGASTRVTIHPDIAKRNRGGR